ncbi:MAG TPA: hypothetical protein VMT80_02660 [Candidatus Paceibacterota bacterium]|nr:hypothetical protein [Candidatus Paceibacterota bacterium]
MAFSGLFGKKAGESMLLIDIGAASVAGAAATHSTGDDLSLAYAKRVAIEHREGEAAEEAMIRALETVADALVVEGAPALARAGGAPHAHRALISLDAPWQETELHTEKVERRDAFVITRQMLSQMLKKALPDMPGKTPVDESVIGTIVNGYETREPFGKRGRRVTFILLTSYIVTETARRIVGALRKRFPHVRLMTIAGPSLRYRALASVFPHERDALIVDATAPQVSIALVRRGLLAAVSETPPAGFDAPQWVSGIESALARIATEYPLPRTVLLLAREAEIARVREALEAPSLGKAWLVDTPPKIISVLASHVAPSAPRPEGAAPDLVLELMLRYAQNRPEGEEEEGTAPAPAAPDVHSSGSASESS